MIVDDMRFATRLYPAVKMQSVKKPVKVIALQASRPPNRSYPSWTQIEAQWIQKNSHVRAGSLRIAGKSKGEPIPDKRPENPNQAPDIGDIGVFVRTNTAWMLPVAMRILQDKGSAEDTVQVAFTRFLPSWARFKSVQASRP